MKLAKLGITGPFLDLLKEFHSDTSNIIRLNGMLSNEFSSTQGVRQGDNLTPSLFSLYLNGLLTEMKQTNVGLNVGTGCKVNVLAYADDVVLLSYNENDMQKLLNVLAN